MAGLGDDRVHRSPAEAGLPGRAVRVVPQPADELVVLAPVGAAEEGVRLDAGPHDVGVVGVGVSCQTRSSARARARARGAGRPAGRAGWAGVRGRARRLSKVN